MSVRSSVRKLSGAGLCAPVPPNVNDALPVPVSYLPLIVSTPGVVRVRAWLLAVPALRAAELRVIFAAVIVVALSAAKVIFPLASSDKLCCVVMLSSSVDSAFIVPPSVILFARILVPLVKTISPPAISVQSLLKPSKL